MPTFAGLFVLLLLFIIGYTVSLSKKAIKKGLEQDTKQKALAEQLKTVQDNFDVLEKRLGNVEVILTDSQFMDPPTSGREAIDLKLSLIHI